MSSVIRLSSARARTEAGVEGSLDDSLEQPRPSLFGPVARNESDPAESDLERKNREESMLDQLDKRDRLRLVEFVCSFAWADLEIQPEERVFIARLIRRLELDEEEDLQVQRWLDRPPHLDDLDPTSIPAAHRRVIVEAIEGLISADGEISEEELESFEIFKQLLVD